MPTNAHAVTRMTVAQAAEALDVSPQTMRRYSWEFRNYLSADATPDPGGTRFYSPDDIQILGYARRQLLAGETYERTCEYLETVSLDPIPEATPNASPGVDLAPLQSAVSAVFVNLDRIDQTLQSALTQATTDRHTLIQLAADVDKVKDAQSRRRPDAVIALLWFGAGFALALVAIYLFTLMR